MFSLSFLVFFPWNSIQILSTSTKDGEDFSLFFFELKLFFLCSGKHTHRDDDVGFEYSHVHEPKQKAYIFPNARYRHVVWNIAGWDRLKTKLCDANKAWHVIFHPWPWFPFFYCIVKIFYVRRVVGWYELMDESNHKHLNFLNWN